MLTAHIDRYVALRQTLGFKLRDTARLLHAFARFAAARGDTHIRTSTAVAWATEAPSPSARHIRLRDVMHLARFLHAEDAAHEVPSAALFPALKVRPLPYIYAPD
jgi:integrase/recombinase XerD